VRGALDRLGLAENTIVMFVSDNGGLSTLAGFDPRPAQHRDGVDLRPLLGGSGRVSRDAIFIHFPHYHGSGNRPSSAVRAGDWKLVEWLEDGRLELYDLAKDPGETRDLALEEPAVAARLKATLDAWRKDVGARMPTRR
jgi:arylsulfatase A-like enzyme